MSFIYMMVYNYILTEIITVNKIGFIHAYAVFYIVKMIFNRNKINMNVEQEIFDSFKRTFMKCVHYTVWGVVIKLMLMYF